MMSRRPSPARSGLTAGILCRLYSWALLFLAACAEAPPEPSVPLDITSGHICALDGMILVHHDGPKAQLLRRDGSRAFFCDAKEAFEETLDPRRQKRLRAVWFQTLDEAPWESHPDGWALAEPLFFVGGSAKIGPMGPTLVPFKDRTKAAAFAATYGGKIYTYPQITPPLINTLKMQGINEM